MKKLVLLFTFLTLSSVAAQEVGPVAGPFIPVPLSEQERKVILTMCEAARWSNRQGFDGACEFFKKKFDDAVTESTKSKETTPQKD